VRVFSILSVGMGLLFLGLAAWQLRHPEPAITLIAVHAIVAALSFLGAFERLAHRTGFVAAALLGGLLWLVAEPGWAFALERDIDRPELGLAIATGWVVILAFAAQRVSARRLIEGA